MTVTLALLAGVLNNGYIWWMLHREYQFAYIRGTASTRRLKTIKYVAWINLMIAMGLLGAAISLHVEWTVHGLLIRGWL